MGKFSTKVDAAFVLSHIAAFLVGFTRLRCVLAAHQTVSHNFTFVSLYVNYTLGRISKVQPLPDLRNTRLRHFRLYINFCRPLQT